MSTNLTRCPACKSQTITYVLCTRKGTQSNGYILRCKKCNKESEIAASFIDFQFCDPETWEFTNRKKKTEPISSPLKSSEKSTMEQYKGTFQRIPKTVMVLDELDLLFLTSMFRKTGTSTRELTSEQAHEMVYAKTIIRHSDFGCPTCSSHDLEFYPGDTSTKGWYCLRCTDCKTHSDFFCVLNAHQLKPNWKMDHTLMPKVPYALIPPVGVMVAFGQLVAKKAMDAMHIVFPKPQSSTPPVPESTELTLEELAQKVDEKLSTESPSKTVKEPEKSSSENVSEPSTESSPKTPEEDALIVLTEAEAITALTASHRTTQDLGMKQWSCPKCHKKEIVVVKRKSASGTSHWNMFEFALHCSACKHTSQFEPSVYAIGYKLADACKWARAHANKPVVNMEPAYDSMGCYHGYD